jgi:SH3 domain-containing protein
MVYHVPLNWPKWSLRESEHFMGREFTICVLAVLFTVSLGFGQNPSTQLRKYRAAYMDVPLRSAPDPAAKQVGTIPMGTTVAAIEKNRHWVRVKIKNKEGWAASTAMERIMDVPAPDLEFYSNGYKIIGSKYRYFFGISNAGLVNYTDKIILRLYANETQIFTETYAFADKPISATGGRTLYVDTNTQALKFEFETKDGKYSGPIGQFIERM